MSQPPTSDYAALPRSAADHHAEAIGHAARAADLAKQAREEWRRAAVAEYKAGVEHNGKPDPKALLQSARYDIEARDFGEAIDTATEALELGADVETLQALHKVILTAEDRLGGAP